MSEIFFISTLFGNRFQVVTLFSLALSLPDLLLPLTSHGALDGVPPVEALAGVQRPFHLPVYGRIRYSNATQEAPGQRTARHASSLAIPGSDKQAAF